jgi:hypothetical protein
MIATRLRQSRNGYAVLVEADIERVATAKPREPVGR